MVEAVFGALSQVGIDLGLRGDPCACRRVREVAVGIAENFGDATVQVWSLDQDHPAPLSRPALLVKQPLCGWSMLRAHSWPYA
jgi:hypothetical protein